MITPVQSNFNNTPSFGSLNVERIRVPRKSNSNINFEGNPVSSDTKKTGFLKKAFDSVKNGVNKIIHSKFVQNIKKNAKKNIKKFFKKSVAFIRSIPGKISEKFKNLKNKKA